MKKAYEGHQLLYGAGIRKFDLDIEGPALGTSASGASSISAIDVFRSDSGRESFPRQRSCPACSPIGPSTGWRRRPTSRLIVSAGQVKLKRQYLEHDGLRLRRRGLFMLANNKEHGRHAMSPADTGINIANFPIKGRSTIWWITAWRRTAIWGVQAKLGVT